MDEDQLTPQIIEQLIKYMPKPEQMSQLAELKLEYKTMAEPEQFAVVVSITCTFATGALIDELRIIFNFGKGNFTFNHRCSDSLLNRNWSHVIFANNSCGLFSFQ